MSSNARLARLQALRRRAVPRAAARRWSGTRQRVLVTGRAVKGTGELQGRTDNNRVVNFAGDAALVHRYVDVDITAALAHSLRGTFVAAERREPQAAAAI